MKKLMRGCLIGIGVFVGLFILLGVLGAALSDSEPSTARQTSPTAASNGSSEATSKRFDRSNWAELVSAPDDHQGALVEIVGKVFTAPEKDGTIIRWQMWADPKQNEWNTLVSYDNPGFAVKEGDFVRVIGTVRGARSGENAFGAKLTAPLIDAESVAVVDALAAAPLAKRVAELNVTQEQHSLQLHVAKIEFAEEETRLFITVRNASPHDASFYRFNAKAVQGTTQYDAEYEPDYPEVQSELLAGIESSGVVVFPAMQPDQPSKFVLDARTNDFSLDFTPYVFEVQP